MFERLEMIHVDQFCRVDLLWGAMGPLIPSCLEEMEDLSYEDHMALYVAMKGMVQNGQYHFDIVHTHTRLAIACIEFVRWYVPYSSAKH